MIKLKKPLSMLMSVALMAGSISMPTFATSTPTPKNALNFYQYDKGLFETPKGLVFEALRDEETTVKWDISSGGKYELSYHLETINKTVKYDIELNVGSKKESTSIVSDPKYAVLTVKNSESLTQYQEHLYPFQGKWGAIQKGEFVKNLALDNSGLNIGESEKQVSILIDGTYSLRVKIEKNTAYLYVNKVTKGNITEFTLKKGGATASTNVLTGLKDFEILPTHLYEEDGVLKSKENITYPDEIPGSQPGVDIKIERPKKVNEHGVFDYISDSDAQGLQAAIVLWIENSQGTGNKQLLLRFNFGNSSLITGDSITGVKRTVADGKALHIYVSSKIDHLPTQQQSVIQWGELSKSQILGCTMEIGGPVIEGVEKTSFTPMNKGYTYLEYRARKSDMSEAYISISPYRISAPAKYIIYQRYLDQGNGWNKLLEYNYDGGKDLAEEIILAVTSTVEQYYKIEVMVEGQSKPYISQYMKYNPLNEATPPTTTSIINVDNIYAVEDEETKETVVGFDVSWKAPDKDVLLKYLVDGEFYYELFLYSGDQQTKNYSKVFKITSKDGKNISVEPYAGKAGSDIRNVVRYDEGQKIFVMENVVLKELENSGWDRLEMPKNYMDRTSYPTVGHTEDDIQVISDLNYELPTTMYISMRAVYEPNKGINTSSIESGLFPITFSKTKEVLEVPSKITSKSNVTITSEENEILTAQDIMFNNVDIRRYVDLYLNPLKWNLYDNPTTYYQGNYYIYLYGKNVAAGAINNVTTYKDVINEQVVLTEEEKMNIHNGKVIAIRIPEKQMIGDKDLGFTLVNLEPNEVYYIKIQEKLNAWKSMLDGTKVKKEIVSSYSKEHTFTSYVKPSEPGPDEMTPPAPLRLEVIDKSANNSATLEWEAATFTPPNKDAIVYQELVRVSDKKLSDIDLSREIAIDELGKKEGIKAYLAKNTNIQVYDKNSASWEELNPTQAVSKNTLMDNELAPNRVYYYYVRTVYEYKGQVLRSEWAMTSLTTTPVERPIKVKVESPLDYSYNKKNEVVVSFLAPIPSDSNIPGDFDFEFALLGDNDPSYRLDYETIRLVSKDTSTMQGYVHYVYKINGLKHGSKYNLKVRVVDKKLTDEIMEYSKSLYSDVISFRTEFDQVQSEKDQAIEDYLKKYDSEVNKLKNREYWIVDNGTNIERRKYRPGYMPSMGTFDNIIAIEIPENVTDFSFYMPFDMWETFNTKNKSIELKSENIAISIRPNSLPASNAKVTQMKKEIGKGSKKDFYVRVDVKLVKSSMMIYGQPQLTPQVMFDIDLVYVNDLDKNIETKLLNNLLEVSAKHRDLLSEKLINEISNKKLDKEVLNELTETAIKKVADVINTDSKNILKKALLDEVVMNTLDKPALLTVKLNVLGPKAFYYTGTWDKVESYMVGNEIFVELKKQGFYTITGTLSNGLPVSGLSQKQQDTYNKYGLSEFFGLDNNSLNKAITKREIYGIVAKVLGSPNGMDYSSYLKLKGIQGIVLLQDQAISKSEAIYMLMQAYEKIYYTSVNNIAMNKVGLVSNINEFQINHRPYILAAAELEIIQPVNKKVANSTKITPIEVLKILEKIAY